MNYENKTNEDNNQYENSANLQGSKDESLFNEISGDAAEFGNIFKEFGDEIGSPALGKALVPPATIIGFCIVGSFWAIGKLVDKFSNNSL